MKLFIIIAFSVAIILAILVIIIYSHWLKNEINFENTRIDELDDEDTNDQLERAVKYFKIVNK